MQLPQQVGYQLLHVSSTLRAVLEPASKTFHVAGHGDDDEDGDGQDDVNNQKDGMERRQMRPLMYL